ncbi:penicillin-binding transpeptidase domain-containing protein [Streptomyces sp. NPDC101227]|uniref:penicillin-binding transpeptidase domain-containing protein n=1 Tax=Streptomyces sp. NPDC101227 TaxID=3366136 RepID=UPI0037F31D15
MIVMPSTKRRRASVAAALFALFSAPLSGCTTGGDTHTDSGKRPGTPHEEQSPPRPPKTGLGNIIVAGRAITGSKPTGLAKFPYERTYTDGELYASVTGYRTMMYGWAGLEGVYDDVLRPTSPKSGPLGNVVTAIDPAVQKAAADALRGRKGSAVAVDVRTGHIRALFSAPSYDPGAFSGSHEDDVTAWKKLTSDENEPLLNRPVRGDAPPGDAFHLVVAAAALEKGLYSSVDEATHSPVSYAVPGGTGKFTGDRAHCKNASIRTALRYACDNVFARMAVDVGQRDLAAMAETFGFNDDKLLMPVRVLPSNYPRKARSAADLASVGDGAAGVTATPLEMARVMAVIAGGGRQVNPQLVTQVIHADGSSQGPKDAATGSGRVVGRKTADQLRSALQGSGTGGVTGWELRPDTGGHGEAAAWSVSFTRFRDGSPLALAVCLTVPAAAGDRSGHAQPVVRVAQQITRAAAAPRSADQPAA